jgi:salicylate hydroxylase
MDHTAELLIAGAGLGGLAAALACAPHAGRIVLLEQAPALQEVGAGIQCSPNMTRRWRAWGLMPALAAFAHAPGAVIARDAASGRELGRLDTRDFEHRYGAPYLTVHRADLQAALAGAVARHAENVQLQLGTRISAVRTLPPGAEASADLVALHAETAQGSQRWHARLLLGADGLHSVVRKTFWPQAAVPSTGELAWRGMVRMADLPATLRVPAVQAWLGPRTHVVSYPVRGGEWLNVAAFTENADSAPALETAAGGAWTSEGTLSELLAAMGGACAPLRDTLAALPRLRRWVVHARAPIAGAEDLHAATDSPVALLGDAAHPMQPYMAQGAAMALEDAEALGRAIAAAGVTPAALAQYARQRWARNAQVQARSARNGGVFHAAGPLRLARNLALAIRPQVMDVPWLYRY